MSVPASRRPLRLLVMALLALLPALFLTGPAQAAPLPSTPLPAEVFGHTCGFNGPTDGSTAYYGDWCVDFDKSGTSMRALGQAFCQKRSDSVVVRCKGAIQKVTIESTVYAPKSATYSCGTLGSPGSVCPTGRMSGPSPHIFCPVPYTDYTASVETKVVTPDNVTIRLGVKSITARSACY